jgi:hypothetical protein
VLSHHGYHVVGHQFRRPGKEGRGWSGTIRGGVSIHFSSKDPLFLNKPRVKRSNIEYGVCDSFDVYRLMFHGGNVLSAIKAAVDILGVRVKQRPDRIVLSDIYVGTDGVKFIDAFKIGDAKTVKAIAQKHTKNRLQVNRIVTRCQLNARAAA